MDGGVSSQGLQVPFETEPDEVLKVAAANVYPLGGAASRVYAGTPVGGPHWFVLPLTSWPVRTNYLLPPEFGRLFLLFLLC